MKIYYSYINSLKSLKKAGQLQAVQRRNRYIFWSINYQFYLRFYFTNDREFSKPKMTIYIFFSRFLCSKQLQILFCNDGNIFEHNRKYQLLAVAAYRNWDWERDSIPWQFSDFGRNIIFINCILEWSTYGTYHMEAN